MKKFKLQFVNEITDDSYQYILPALDADDAARKCSEALDDSCRRRGADLTMNPYHGALDAASLIKMGEDGAVWVGIEEAEDWENIHLP